MALEVASNNVVCVKCGTMYGKRQSNFFVSYATSYKGIGFIPICRNCVEQMYDMYMNACGDSRKAVRQVCRKLDLYWNDSVFSVVEKKSSPRTIMSLYISKINTGTNINKSYDDTLKDEGMLWTFGVQQRTFAPTGNESTTTLQEYEVSDEVKTYWGPGYSPEMYMALEDRRAYWMKHLPAGVELDVGTEALIRQICSTELDINRGRANGEDVNKSISTLNTLLGSAKLKPSQKKDVDDSDLVSTPLGVWLYRYENERPLPEIDDSLKDVNRIRRYIFIWMGHLCKMLGLKNAYSQMYEDEIAKLRVEKPEYDGDDEEFFESVMDEYDDEESDDG